MDIDLRDNNEDVLSALSLLDLKAPIKGSDLRGFADWVEWNGYLKCPIDNFKPEREGFAVGFNRQLQGLIESEHLGYDFACYVNREGKCIVGLSERTPVRAVYDGEVVKLENRSGYYNFIALLHDVKSEDRISGFKKTGRFINRFLSMYGHVSPQVKLSDKVKRDDTIADLFPNNDLIHLHFSLGIDQEVDPARVISGLELWTADPPKQKTSFRLIGADGKTYQPEIIAA